VSRREKAMEGATIGHNFLAHLRGEAEGGEENEKRQATESGGPPVDYTGRKSAKTEPSG